MEEYKKRVIITPGRENFVGQKMVEWALGEAPRPTTVAELKEQLGDAITLSPTLANVMFIDTPSNTALFRLPPAEMLRGMRDRIRTEGYDVSEYALPSYYEIEDVNSLSIAKDPEQLFYSRVGDYTTQECE